MLCLRFLVLLGGLLICFHLSTAENEPLGPSKGDTGSPILANGGNIKLEKAFDELRAEVAFLREKESRDVLAGRSYVHWGRARCPALNAKMVYSGYIAGGHYLQSGSGRDYICTTDTPAFLTPTGSSSKFAYIYGTEYSFTGVFKSDNVNARTLQDIGAVCSVCEAQTKHDVIMIPGTYRCPTGWKVEYKGFLAAMYYEHHGTNHICLDQAPEGITGSSQNLDGDLLYPVRAKCGTLPCPPYVHNKEVSCVVCSK